VQYAVFHLDPGDFVHSGLDLRQTLDVTFNKDLLSATGLKYCLKGSKTYEHDRYISL